MRSLTTKRFKFSLGLQLKYIGIFDPTSSKPVARYRAASNLKRKLQASFREVFSPELEGKSWKMKTMADILGEACTAISFSTFVGKPQMFGRKTT